MTILSEVNRIKGNVSNAYDVLETKGATMPVSEDTDSLARTVATIETITIDSELSSSSTNPIQNKVLYPSLSGFLPARTVISVKNDGSGDFTNLNDAISFLEGKWSNGVVTIQIGSGTFNNTTTVVIDNNNFNIPKLKIIGNGETNTILDSNGMEDAQYLLKLNNGLDIEISDLKITNSSGSILTGYRGIEQNSFSNLILNNIKCEGINRLATIYNGAKCMLTNNITIEQARTGFMVDSGFLMLNCNLQITDSQAGIFVRFGGTVKTSTSATYTTANITEAIHPIEAVGTAINDGWITGITV